ncbi:MAG: ferritin family protein [Burkholderiales bacterium]
MNYITRSDTGPGRGYPRRRPPDQRPLRTPAGRDFQLSDEIGEAVIREVHAYNYYTKLAALAPGLRLRQAILRIRQDEAEHYGSFTTALQRLGARMPMIPAGAAPASFQEGLREAIKAENEAAAFYNSVASRAKSRSIQTQFMNAARDEQQHSLRLRHMVAGA